MAEAYYALSNMHLNPRDAMEKARAAAVKALHADNSQAEAHASLAVVKAFYEWDWDGADREFRRALELDPAWAGTQGWYGAFLALMGRVDESIAELARARRHDPLSLAITSTTALPLYLAGRYDEALAQTRRALELEPNFPLARVGMGVVYEQQGRLKEALVEYQMARRLDDSPEIAAFLARGYALAGRRADALHLLSELLSMSQGRYVSPYDIALIHAGLGESELALDWLEKGYAGRSEGMVNLKTDPRWGTLRSHARFQELFRRMRFP
jgi:Tfp pilus assembly protein PilF